MTGALCIGGKVSSDAKWKPQFAQKYCKSKGLNKDEYIKRVSHAIAELENQGLVEARSTKEKGAFVCEVTDSGKEIIPYLTKS